MSDPITNSVIGIADKVLGKFVPDKNLKMQLEHELKTQLQTANLAQIEVNKIEAASKSWFVAGLQVALPEFEFSQLSTILMAMLGMAGLRTYEKQQKVTKGN